MKRRRLQSEVKIRRVKMVHKSLRRYRVAGFAYVDDEPYVEVDPNQSDREYFLTCVHELFHILLPDLSEKQILRLEKTFGQCLWASVRRLKRKWQPRSKKRKIR